jgi:hypothetical protein
MNDFSITGKLIDTSIPDLETPNDNFEFRLTAPHNGLEVELRDTGYCPQFKAQTIIIENWKGSPRISIYQEGSFVKSVMDLRNGVWVERLKDIASNSDTD